MLDPYTFSDGKKNFFPDPAQIEVTSKQLMDKCGICHHTKFTRLLNRFNVQPSPALMSGTRKSGKLFTKKEASKFVTLYRSQKEGDSPKLTLAEVGSRLSKLIEKVNKHIVRQVKELQDIRSATTQISMSLSALDTLKQALTALDSENRDIKQQLSLQESLNAEISRRLSRLEAAIITESPKNVK